MVVGASCSGGIRLTSDAARACCEVTTGSSYLVLMILAVHLCS